MTVLKLLKESAEEIGVEAICMYCVNFRGSWCELTEEPQIPHGICEEWELPEEEEDE
jgi:hypothetical protein